MPTYAYACTSCDNRFEVHQSFSDDSLTRCERCEGTLRKLFNSVGIVFKGSGFYRTDSRAATSATAPGGSGNGGSASGKDGKDSSDSKGSSTSEGSGSSNGKGSGSSSGTKESATTSSRAPAAAAKT